MIIRTLAAAALLAIASNSQAYQVEPKVEFCQERADMLAEMWENRAKRGYSEKQNIAMGEKYYNFKHGDQRRFMNYASQLVTQWPTTDFMGPHTNSYIMSDRLTACVEQNIWDKI